MRRSGFKSLGEISVRAGRGVPPADLSCLLQAAFHLPTNTLKARREGEILVLTTADKTVAFALGGMDGQIVSFVASRGYDGIKRVRWSAA